MREGKAPGVLVHQLARGAAAPAQVPDHVGGYRPEDEGREPVGLTDAPRPQALEGQQEHLLDQVVRRRGVPQVAGRP